MKQIPIRMTVSGDGRLQVQTAIALPPGDYDAVLVVAGVDQGRPGWERAQAIVRRYVPAGRQISAELIQARREAAARE